LEAGVLRVKSRRWLLAAAGLPLILAQTLPRMGALLENYYAIGHSSAAN
jgi:hypothetical protein